MPEVAVHLKPGRSEEQKRAFRASVIAAAIEHLSMPERELTPESVKFSFTESEQPSGRFS